MAQFEDAFPVLVQHEGTTFVDDPDDNGGATKFGLTLGFLKETTDPNFSLDELRDLTEETAASIYQKTFWDKFHLGNISDQTTATKVLDILVNLGYSRGTRIVQAACNACNIPTHIDGCFGPQTLAAINKSSNLLSKLRSSLIVFYEHIVAHNPKQKKFLKGWLNRAKS